MASKYNPNRWELYNPNIPNEEQPHSFITKRKLEKMEQGIEAANITLEVGEITTGEEPRVTITEDIENKTRKLNITFPPGGVTGKPGKSAYDIWLELGNTGSEQEFMDYLKGKDGKDGQDGRDGIDGEQGPAGESAYQLWLGLGNTGSIEDFLNSLKGEKGEDGIVGRDGVDGKSAYQIWIDAGNAGTEADFISSLAGEDGEDGEDGQDGAEGKSAYEVWKMLPGNENKLITEFFESLKGEPGSDGAAVAFVDFA